MRNLTIITLLLCLCTFSYAQERKIFISDSLTNEFLDTVTVAKKLKLNDYSMIGVQYGVGMSQMMWNPQKNQKALILPYNLGITYTVYGKMFGYMPYFGFQAGLFYTQEGYCFDNEDKKYKENIAGAEKAIMDVIEVPVLSHMHIDFWHMKIIAQIGMFVGYRTGIHRYAAENMTVKPEIETSFLPTDNRFDYGIKGGVGFGLVFDPIELHFQAMYKHSLSSIYEPDHDPNNGKYFYKFAYPTNIVISAGIHFQLTKRSGMTKKELKQQAKSIVYETGNTNGKSR